MSDWLLSVTLNVPKLKRYMILTVIPRSSFTVSFQGSKNVPDFRTTDRLPDLTEWEDIK